MSPIQATVIHMGERKLRLAPYFRVSSQTQKTEDTIQRQIDNFDQASDALLADYAFVPRFVSGNQSDPKTRFFIDDGYNLEQWDEATALHDLLSRCKRGEIDAVWVSETDRLGRSRSAELRGRIQDVLRDHDIRVLTKNGEIPLGLLFEITSSIGAADKRAFMLKLQEAKILRAEREGRPPSGKNPFGFERVKITQKWEIVKSERCVILSAIGLMIGKVFSEMPPAIVALAQAHPEGLPDPQIAEALNATGFSLEAYYRRNNYGRFLEKNPTGKIPTGFMSTLIRDDRYRGAYSVYLKDPRLVGRADSKNMDRDKKRCIIIPMPRILSDEDWTELRARRASRQVRAERNVVHDYLLKDLVICDVCGIPLSARPKWPKKSDGTDRNSRPTLYYVCWRKKKINGYQCTASRCHNAPKLDALVFDEIKQIVLKPETINSFVATATQLVVPPSVNQYEKSLHDLEKRLHGLADERKRAVANLNRGLFSDDDFAADSERIVTERRGIEKLTRDLSRKIASIEEALKIIPAVDLEPIRRRLIPRIESLNFEERRSVVATLVHQVRIKPTGEMRLLLRPIKMP